jgi:orotate phosphoribosyltransferase
MYTHEEIWAGLDKLAEAKGYSPSGLAKKAGLDPTSFNKSKRISPDGKPRWPSTESLSKVLTVTHTTMNEFFDLISPSPYDLGKMTAARKKEIAAVTAEILIETKSVLFNAKEPFTLTSGKKSPVYIDCRKLIGFYEERELLMDCAAEMLISEIGYDNMDYMAGGETAGIPYAAFISERLEKPMVYVRKKPKGFGRMAQIEGYFPEEDSKEGKNVVLIEDLQTDGGSKKVFFDALRDAGATVEHAFVVFHYGIFEASKQNMKDMGVTLHSLCEWWDVLAVAKESGYFDAHTLAVVEAFLKDPIGWQGANS